MSSDYCVGCGLAWPCPQAETEPDGHRKWDGA